MRILLEGISNTDTTKKTPSPQTLYGVWGLKWVTYIMSKLLIERYDELDTNRDEIRNIVMVFNHKGIYGEAMITQILSSIGILNIVHLTPSFRISRLFSDWFYSFDIDTDIREWYNDHLRKTMIHLPGSIVKISGRHINFGIPLEFIWESMDIESMERQVDSYR